jgi:Arc/MetJ-type ribon-helix-helix transcriptional regulator
MNNIRMTIRLPQKDARIIDMFVRSGEFSTRSEFVRRAVKEYSQNHMNEVIRRTKAMKKLQDMVNILEQTEEYTRK